MTYKEELVLDKTVKELAKDLNKQQIEKLFKIVDLLNKE